MPTIVLADDHQDIRTLVREFLATMPEFQIVGEATRGEEALELVKRLKPDILITDLNMGGLSGIEVTRQIHRQFPSIGIILWSASSEEKYALEAWEAGATSYILKSTGLSKLLDAILEITRGIAM
jgi:two-component system response regulator NreC